MSDSPFAPDADIVQTGSLESSASPESWPRISIFDLMVWMSASALFLALFDSDELKGAEQNLFNSQQIVYGIVSGAQLAALLAVIRACRRNNHDRFVQQPGHWLLVVPIPWLLILLVGAVSSFLTGGAVNSSFVQGSWVGWVYLFASIATAVVWGFAASYSRGGWRLFYVLSVANGVLSSVMMLAIATTFGMSLIQPISMGTSLLSLILVAVMIWLLIKERSIRHSRSWMHWVGVVGWLIFELLGFLFNLLWSVLQ